ncbi:hypothetical protein [Limnothrix sp. FACHB-881]|uniref:hypothetical protein n=1 Tax=Limnothrix sp. FACHB-881 TaxID=2692819 RepID=UPI00168205D8|nr:hypothetical protein [Limnothrix sp. FACHB-881]
MESLRLFRLSIHSVCDMMALSVAAGELSPVQATSAGHQRWPSTPGCSAAW